MTLGTRPPRRALLFVLAVVALAAAGVVYAHWTDTLKVDAQVNTGTAANTVTAANTDDDGTPNGWDFGDNGGGTKYDAWGATSSDDPSSYTSSTSGSRYDKDVARCRVTETVGHMSTVVVENAYPSYHCTIRQAVRNTGSIPLANQATRVSVCLPALADCSDPGNYVAVPYTKSTDSFVYESGDGPDFELLMQQNPEGACGWQFDPNATFGNRMTFHVLQGAEQDTSYLIRFELDQVNWNEWSLGNCSGFDRYTPTGGGTTYPIP
jgi:predicted ribosomally synthesized peptide with SipW-like signal peptide